MLARVLEGWEIGVLRGCTDVGQQVFFKDKVMWEVACEPRGNCNTDQLRLVTGRISFYKLRDKGSLLTSRSSALTPSLLTQSAASKPTSPASWQPQQNGCHSFITNSNLSLRPLHSKQLNNAAATQPASSAMLAASDGLKDLGMTVLTVSGNRWARWRLSSRI